MRRIVLGCLILLGVVGSASLASAIAPTWFPNQVLSMNALLVHGAPAPRFQIAHIGDDYTAKTCVMVILDTETGQMAATSVDPESCAVRRIPPVVVD